MSFPNANQTSGSQRTSQTTGICPVPPLPGIVSAGSAAPSPAISDGPATPRPVASPAKGPAKTAAKRPAKGPAKSPVKKTVPAPQPANNMNIQPTAKKQKPAAPSGAGCPPPAGSNGPPAKKQRLAIPKPNQPAPAAQTPVIPNNRGNINMAVVNTPSNKADTDNGPVNANATPPVSTLPPTPRPRGRPPGPATIAKRQAAAAAGLVDPRVKPERSSSADGGPRGAKKAASRPALPWTAVPAEPRVVLSDDTSLLENGMFADATIVCLKSTWRVHKSVLCTRSRWFLKAFAGDQEGGQTGIVNLHSHSKEDVETLLKFIYAGLKLEREKSNIERGNFALYVRLFNLSETFELKPLMDDALSLLGQYCDKKLVDLCSYDVGKSGREGVVDQIRGSPKPFIDDLLKAIKDAYDGSEHPNRLHAILASFVWAGRDRLFREKELLAFVDVCPRFGTDMFKLMLGHNPGKWLPPAKVARTMCTELDHSRKTQHPDRCEGCEDVFDEDKVRKALYNPFNVAVRAGAWCATCVNKNTGAPLWRRMSAGNEAER